MTINVGTNIHHMILKHLSSYAMYTIKGIPIYVGLNKHCEISDTMQFNFSYFVYEYEKGSNEISYYYRTYVVNNVLEVYTIDTNYKYKDSFRMVLVNNIYHRFDHV